MSTIQPFIDPACMFAYGFSARLDESREFAFIKADIQQELKGIFHHELILNRGLHTEMATRVFKYENFETFAEMVVLMMKYKKLGKALLDYFDDVEKAKNAIETAYQGAFANKLEFTYRYVEKLEPIPGCLEAYIDYERLTQDLFMNEFFSVETGNETHVFKRAS
jgi:hypothetical protein